VNTRLRRCIIVMPILTAVVILCPVPSYSGGNALAGGAALTPLQIMSRSFRVSAGHNTFRALWVMIAEREGGDFGAARFPASAAYKLRSPKWTVGARPTPPRFRAHLGAPGNYWESTAAIGGRTSLMQQGQTTCERNQDILGNVGLTVRLIPGYYGQLSTLNEWLGVNESLPIIPESSVPFRQLLKEARGATLRLVGQTRLPSGRVWHERFFQTHHYSVSDLKIEFWTRVDYFVSVRNLTLRQVRVREWSKFRTHRSVAYDSTLNATFFDYGKPVHIQLPRKCRAA
jgi:hypothetical protein